MSTQTHTGRRTAGAVRDDYLELIRTFPLRPLRNDRDYTAAAAMLDRLVVRPEKSLTAGERDYLDTLTMLVESYDEEHYRIETQHLTPLEMLKYLMQEHHMRTADLGDLLGNRPLASLILHEHRGLSKTHIRILSAYFKVEPGLFL